MSENTVTFGSETDSYSFRFLLEAAENSGKTIFAPSDRARLKLYPGDRKPSLTVSSGQAKIHLSGLRQTVTEFLAFKDSNSAKTTFHIESVVSALWEGSGTGKPAAYGTRLVLPAKTTGVMKIVYETSYDLVDVTCPRPTYSLVTATADGLGGNTLVDFTDGFLTDIYDREVVLTVRDACSRETQPDAHVYINGKYQGKTDQAGIIRLGSMKAATYSLKITKEGFQPTDSDSVSNDFFTVE